LNALKPAADGGEGLWRSEAKGIGMHVRRGGTN
jgi:hypothetical protein